MDELIRYYEDVIGLFLSHRDDTCAVLSTRQGLECIVLEHGERPELVGICFEISPRMPLEQAQAVLGKAGLPADIRKGRSPSLARVLAFKDPKGTEIELFNSIEFVATDAKERGINALKLGHVAYFLPASKTPRISTSTSSDFVNRTGAKAARCFSDARPITTRSICSRARRNSPISPSKLRIFRSW